MSTPIIPLSTEELNRICYWCKYTFSIHSFKGQHCPKDGNGMVNGWSKNSFLFGRDVPKQKSICPCGIVRIDCDYHK